MKRSLSRPGLLLALALSLTLVASACSKKSDTTTSTGSSSPSTTAAGTKGTTAKPTVTKPGGPCGEWPKGTIGQPESAKTPDTAGFFIWQDVSGWHIRVRSTATKEPFKGTIRGSRNMAAVKEVPAGAGKKVELKDNVVTFEIPPTGELTGFDLTAGCNVDQLQFQLLVGNNPASADAIFVGHQGKAVSPVFTQAKTS